MAENAAADTAVGTPFTADDADGDDITYLLEGVGRDAFAIDSASGQLSTRAPLDRETQSNYALTLRADDGNGGADRITVNVNVTNIDEQAGTPAAPVVLARRGSVTSLELTWNAPDAAGGPAIQGYRVQYRAVAAEDEVEELPWLEHRHRGAGTRTAIAYLRSETAYEARVRALNGETAGEWSEPGMGSTGAAINSPPVFGKDLPVELSVGENSAAGAEIGMPFSASDSDEDTLTYLLEGAGSENFAIDPRSGQLRTKAALDHEDKARHVLVIRADDGRGGTDTLRIGVNVSDEDEQAPPLSAPGVLATAGSTTGLDVRWIAPEANGGPAVIGYEIEYRAGALGEWAAHPHLGAETRATIAELEAGASYQVRVRALNGEIPGDWSEPGEGSTGSSENAAPVFASGLATTLTVAENTGADTGIGTPFTATDSDADILTYLLTGAGRGVFSIDPDSGQLRTRAPLDHETVSSYTLSLQVSDGAGGADSHTVTVEIDDRDERPGRPAPPYVLASAGSTMNLELRWQTPDRSGGPPITAYDVQYRQGDSGVWIDVDHRDASRSATIEGLEVATDYQARVRAHNGETPGEWSEPGTGLTGREQNRAPEFADETATRSVTENSPAGDPVGAPVTAADPDRDGLTYTLEGADAELFDIDPQTGQILVRGALDYETVATHDLRVTAWDGAGGADSIEVAVEVIDTLEEQSEFGPDAPVGVTLGRSLRLDGSNVLHTDLNLRWNAADGDLDAESNSWFEFRLGRYPESDNGITAPAFQCASSRPFETDGWRRIPDSGPGGANSRSFGFDAQALGCFVLEGYLRTARPGARGKRRRQRRNAASLRAVDRGAHEGRGAAHDRHVAGNGRRGTGIHHGLYRTRAGNASGSLADAWIRTRRIGQNRGFRGRKQTAAVPRLRFRRDRQPPGIPLRDTGRRRPDRWRRRARERHRSRRRRPHRRRHRPGRSRGDSRQCADSPYRRNHRARCAAGRIVDDEFRRRFGA